MKPGREAFRIMSKLCGEIREDDGIDPREFVKRERKKSFIKRDRQLCSQVKRILNLVLPELCIRFEIYRCEVTSVEPAPDVTRLSVVICVDADCIDSARMAISKIGGALRAEVAQSINRKKAPDLAFEIIADCEVSDDKRK